jgi:hypothetical protein
MVEEDTVEFWELRIREDTEAMIKAIKDGDRSAQKVAEGHLETSKWGLCRTSRKAVPA